MNKYLGTTSFHGIISLLFGLPLEGCRAVMSTLPMADDQDFSRCRNGLEHRLTISVGRRDRRVSTGRSIDQLLRPIQYKAEVRMRNGAKTLLLFSVHSGTIPTSVMKRYQSLSRKVIEAARFKAKHDVLPCLVLSENGPGMTREQCGASCARLDSRILWC